MGVTKPNPPMLRCDDCGKLTEKGLYEPGGVAMSKVAMPGEEVAHWRPDGSPCQGVWREGDAHGVPDLKITLP